MKPNNIRIKDIASMAGVSVGTVDRVLHNRGKVSRDAARRIEKVLNKINYKPNLIAQTLGKNKNYRIVALIPNPALDPYWKQSFDGLKSGEEQLGQFGIHFILEYKYYDPHKKESFQESALKIFHSHPDGVLVAPLFYYASLPFFKKLSETKIPFILFNTHLVEANALSFIGQDLFKSGRLAGELMNIGQQPNSSYAIVHVNEDLSNSVHLVEKEHGFRDYFEKRGDAQRIGTFILNNLKSSAFQNQLESILQMPDLSGVYVSTSKVYLIAQYLKKRNPGVRIIGYDLIKENVSGLQEGHIDFIINQNPMRQAKLGIQSLANYLIFSKQIPSTYLFPLEVITPENVTSYLAHPGNLAGIVV
ncbi:MAG: substrate-binding domain-containing protein [Cyclobacteriaceae bacterium]|nr:substrate-binding domain-containing protein [Cyclobacteriaceae bacterium]